MTSPPFSSYRILGQISLCSLTLFASAMTTKCLRLSGHPNKIKLSSSEVSLYSLSPAGSNLPSISLLESHQTNFIIGYTWTQASRNTFISYIRIQTSFGSSPLMTSLPSPLQALHQFHQALWNSWSVISRISDIIYLLYVNHLLFLL